MQRNTTFRAHPAEATEKIPTKAWATPALPVFATPIPKTDAAFPYSKFYSPTIVFTTVPFAFRENQMMLNEPLSPLMKSSILP